LQATAAELLDLTVKLLLFCNISAATAATAGAAAEVPAAIQHSMVTNARWQSQQQTN
jgi:hypothetical protein